MPRTDVTGVPNTCPMIDSIIENADAIQHFLEPGHIVSGWESDQIKAAVKTIESLCEDIRNANSELREAATEYHSKMEELQNALDESEARVHELEQDVDHWQSYSESLEQ